MAGRVLRVCLGLCFVLLGAAFLLFSLFGALVFVRIAAAEGGKRMGMVTAGGYAAVALLSIGSVGFGGVLMRSRRAPCDPVPTAEPRGTTTRSGDA